jgi:predicted DsbA family dithiol-disulfide isomerase
VRTDRLKKEYEIEVHWLAFPLHPEVPEEGLTLEELFGTRADISGIMERLKGVAASLSLPMAVRTKTYNSRLAQELAKWAESQGKGDEFHRALFRAYFVDAENIARVDELTGLAASVGLPVDEARQVIQERAFRKAVDADWARSRALGITAVPTFIIGGQRSVGFQPYDVLAEAVARSGAKTRQG